MKQHRSAITGQYVTEQYAKRHPKTTVSEQVKPSTPPPKGKK
jgi:hypothetical protein